MARRTLLISFVCACLLWGGGAFADIDKGPYMQNVKLNEVEIVFEGNTGGQCEWGLTPSYGSSMSSSYSFFTKMNVCQLTGLEENSLYYFQVSSEGDVEQGTFVTATGPGVPFNFVVVGDTRSDHAGHQSVIDGILAYNDGYPDLFFNTGDMVEDGTDMAQWGDYFSIEKQLLLHTVFAPVVGNHENDYGYSLFNRWFTTGSHYWFVYGNALFVVLDTENNMDPYGAQWNMLTDALDVAQNDPDIFFKFIFFHRPGVTTGSHNPNKTIVDFYLDLFEQYNVDVVFNGHNHYYEHGLVNGVHYVVTGGGGTRPASDFEWRDWTVQAEGTLHFCSIDVHPGSYIVTVKRPDGSVVETFDGDINTGGFPGPTPIDLVKSACGIAPVGGAAAALNLLVLLAPLGWIGYLRRRK